MLEKLVRFTVQLVAGLTVLFAPMSHAQTAGPTDTTWANCGDPTKITLAEMESGNLN